MAYSSGLLKEAGLTRKEFALWLGLNPTTISGWDEWPKYAIIILEQHNELRDYRELKAVFSKLAK